MDSTNPVNPVNSDSASHPKSRLSLLAGSIMLIFISLMTTLFVVATILGIMFSSPNRTSGGFADMYLGAFTVIVSAVIWVTVSTRLLVQIISKKSKKALIILLALSSCFTIIGSLLIYLNKAEHKKYVKKETIEDYNNDVKDDVKYYQKAVINYCYYTGRLPKDLEEIASSHKLPQSLKLKRGVGSTINPWGKGYESYLYDPKIFYNLKIDGTGFSVNGTFIGGKIYKMSFDIPAGGCATITPFPYL